MLGGKQCEMVREQRCDSYDVVRSNGRVGYSVVICDAVWYLRSGQRSVKTFCHSLYFLVPVIAEYFKISVSERPIFRAIICDKNFGSF